MQNGKKIMGLICLLVSLPVSFLATSYLHGFLTHQVGALGMAHSFALFFTDAKFRGLFVMLFILMMLGIFVFLMDKKPYRGQLKEIAQGIEIPRSAGQLQHGSARFMTDKEKEQAFAKVVLTSKQLKSLKEAMAVDALED